MQFAKNKTKQNKKNWVWVIKEKSQRSFSIKCIQGLPRGRGLGEGWSGSLGLADASYYI